MGFQYFMVMYRYMSYVSRQQGYNNYIWGYNSQHAEI